MVWNRRPEGSKHPTWSTFLRAHWTILAASYFFNAALWTTKRLVTHYLLFMISLAQVRDEYLYSVRVSREQWQRIDFDKLDNLDVVEALARFELSREMTKAGKFRGVQPITCIEVAVQ